MFKAILNHQQQKLSIHRQLILAFCSVAHLCILYAYIYVAPKAGGADGLSEFLNDCINEIIRGGESTRAAVVFIVMLFIPSAAIIASVILYLRKNYILATETSRGLLTLLFCYMFAYSGYVLFAALLCFVCLFCVHRFYKNHDLSKSLLRG
ncbi:hypothetical protein Trichorick_01854 (plasmid) [Candidatus Trichorickettsia mobilis]|nr:hypothetical protein Trichorick_01854 [Candidatus Trichorickettsia mobilis]